MSNSATYAVAEKNASRHLAGFRECDLGNDNCEHVQARNIAYELYTKKPHPSTLKGGTMRATEDLDPKPWLFISDQIFGEFRSDHDKGYNGVSGTWWAFSPRAEYAQDRSLYTTAKEAA